MFSRVGRYRLAVPEAAPLRVRRPLHVANVQDPPVAVHYMSLVVAFALLLYITRTQWFYFDEWAFLTDRGFAGQPLDLFRPHNEHWSTIPILIYRALFALFAVRSYLPYMAVLLLIHIAVAHLLWRLMRREGVDGWVATSLSAVFLVFGAGWENLIWAFQIGVLGSLAFGLVALLVVATDVVLTPVRQGAIWFLLICGLMCSGIGVTMVAVVAVAVLLRRGPRKAAITVALPAAVYIVWLLLVGRRGLGGVPITAGSLVNLPGYVWTGISSTLDGLSGFIGAGAALAVALLAWWIWKRHDAAIHASAFAGSVGVLVFYIINGLGRAALGVAEATSARYVYIGGALLLPTIGWAITQVARRDLLARLAVLGVMAFSATQGIAQLWGQAREQHVPKAQAERQILAASRLLESGAPVLGYQPDPVLAPELTVNELDQLRRDGDLPSGVTLSKADQLSAVAGLQTTFTDSPALPFGGVHAATVVGALSSRGSDNCLHLQSIGGTIAIRLTYDSPAAISFISPTDGKLEFFLQVNGDVTNTANPISTELMTASAKFLNVLPANATPYIETAIPNLTVCGLIP